MTRKPEDIRNALDTVLSGASHDPTLFNRVVNVSKGDSPPMKRKLTLSLAFVLILSLLTGTVAMAAAYHGVSWFLTEQTCEPTELDPAYLMDTLRQNHTSDRLIASVQDAYWDGKTIFIAYHITANDPSLNVQMRCDTESHAHYRPMEDADILLTPPDLINITVGGTILRPNGSSLDWLYEEDGTLTVMLSFAVNDLSEPINISIPISNTRTANGAEEFAMLHCSFPVLADPIEKHEHDWAPATCVSPKTCRICGRTTGGLGQHDFQPGPEPGQKTCPICTFTIE